MGGSIPLVAIADGLAFATLHVDKDFKQREEAYIKRVQENQLKDDIDLLQFRCKNARSDLDRKRYRSDPKDLEKAESAISDVEAWARNFKPAAVTGEGPKYDRDDFLREENTCGRLSTSSATIPGGAPKTHSSCCTRVVCKCLRSHPHCP